MAPLTVALPTPQVRLVLAQKLLSNHKMAPMETLYFISPICILWMVPFVMLEPLQRDSTTPSACLQLAHQLLRRVKHLVSAIINDKCRAVALCLISCGVDWRK